MRTVESGERLSCKGSHLLVVLSRMGHCFSLPLYMLLSNKRLSNFSTKWQVIISKYRPEEMLHRFQTLKEYIYSCHVPGLNDQHLDRHLDTYLPDNDTW